MHEGDQDFRLAGSFPPESLPGGVTLDAPPEHRALCAWRSLGGDDRVVGAVELLKKRRKSCVYRFATPGEGSIVAKRCRADAAAMESIIYTQLLPRLGLPALRYHGDCDDPDPGFRWIFLEDAGEVTCGQHSCHLAARWLGQLHIKSSDLTDIPLPYRGEGHFLRLLRDALATIAASLDNPELTEGNRRSLDELLSACRHVEQSWPMVALRCAEMPATVLHGDFVPKNIRVKGSDTGNYIMTLDWETAGWGIPAVDILSGVIAPHRGFGDIATYVRTVQVAWPHVDTCMVQRWSAVGMLFRLLASIYWASQDLNCAWLPRTMALMELYLNRLHKALPALQLDSRNGTQNGVFVDV